MKSYGRCNSSIISGIRDRHRDLFFLYALNAVHSRPACLALRSIAGRAAAKQLTTPFTLLTRRLYKVSCFASAR
ncbi:MAG: hypothetical protein U9N82_07510 [Thermodesulfobacteriota bacterium]|nr:hypothetical protein [Thermodesulfobacteriota bacterium]